MVWTCRLFKLNFESSEARRFLSFLYVLAINFLFVMVIKAYFDSRNNERFEMCFFIHKVIRCSKVVIIDDSPMSLKLSTIFEKLSKEFRSVNVMKKSEVVRLSIGGNYILGERDCKSTIFNPANLNFDSFLEIGKYKCKVMINMPNIYFSFPKCVAFDYPVTPDFNEIDKYFDVSACDYKWFKCCSDPRTSQTVNWIGVGTSFSYIPKYDDLGHFLKFECTPSTSRGKAKSMVAVANNPVFHGEPKPERLHAVHRYTCTKNNLMGCSFRMVSYNVLSDIYAKRNEERGKITHCPYYAIDCTYRMELVLKEVAGYNADVICLQEVDQYAYYNMLRTFFEARGYFGVYCLKHPGLNEGLALFFKTVKFRLCESTYVLYPKEMFCKNPVYRYLSEEVSRNKNYAAAFKRSQNSLMCVVLETVADSSKYLVVVNTQLLCNEENSHIRLMQITMAIECLHHVIAKYKQKEPNVRLASVMCGDLNSRPDSHLCRFLTTGSLPADCPDWHSKESEAFEGMPLQHDLRLKSAYTNLPYTNYTTEFKGCLDYIFYSCDDLQLIQTVPIPAESELQAQVALPSLAYPSDHLALVADLEWCRDAVASGPSRLQVKMEDLHVAAGRRGASKSRGRGRGGRGKAAGNT